MLVSGNGERWETLPYTSPIDRFEYSGVEAEAIDLARPETLRRLEEIPSLLMYEVDFCAVSGVIERKICFPLPRQKIEVMLVL